MLNDVTARLASFGYIVESADAWVLDFIITKVQEYIKADCNLSTVPEGLYSVAVDMAAGEFLLSKKSSGQLQGFDLSAIERSIQEGDTRIEFDVTYTPEKRLDVFINYLLNYGKGSFAAYRCLKW